MNYRIRIVELKSGIFTYARQNIHSSIWQCGDVCAITARQAAYAAAHEKLVPVYHEVDDVIRALFHANPDITRDPPEISFDLASHPASRDALSAEANTSPRVMLHTVQPTKPPRGGSREVFSFPEPVI